MMSLATAAGHTAAVPGSPVVSVCPQEVRQPAHQACQTIAQSGSVHQSGGNMSIFKKLT